MPTNHDETLDQRYAREQSEHLAELTKRTPEEIAYMEQLLHNVLAERDQLATKVADTELALFAENQKRQDVERERDQLLEFLCELVDIEGPQPGTAAWADKARTIIAAANLGDSVQVPSELVKGGAA